MTATPRNPTTPTLDALRALVQKWRLMSGDGNGPANYHIRQCANDLEAVLSAALASASAPVEKLPFRAWPDAAPPRAPETPQTPFAWIPQGIAHGPVEILPAVPGWRWVCVSYPDVFKLERVEPAPPPPSESR